MLRQRRQTITTDAMKKDPNFQREASIYVKPVASRELLLQLISEHSKPVSLEQLTQELGLTDPDQIEGLRRRIVAMVRDGQIKADSNNVFQLMARSSLKSGRISATKDGTGYCIFDDVSEPLLIRAQQMRQVFDGDQVLVNERIQAGYEPDGVIVEVTERNTLSIVGNFYRTPSTSYVVPLNKRNQHISIHISGDTSDIAEGALVEVKIDQQPAITAMSQGQIHKVFDRTQAGQEIEIALLNHRLRHEWTEKLLQEAEKVPSAITDQQIKTRFDLREQAFVTIDGEDSKDFDDAVFCKKEKSGFRLWVAIADVSEYVQPGQALDLEAQLRGNSVYFPREVLPMLPERLSNGICSLNPNQDRLALVCEMRVTAKGNVTDFFFFEAVFRSHARLTYGQVASVLENKEKSQLTKEVSANLVALEKVYQAFLHSRNKRGALTIELPELRFIFENDRVKSLTHTTRNIAHKIIEEAMLAANVCAAKLLAEQKIPTLYRKHDDPDTARVTEFQQFLKLLGLRLAGNGEPRPKHFLNLIEQLDKIVNADIILMQILRTMSKAEYTPDQLPHFGLAYESYTHFTSPIRRYPDLLVHRAIRSLIHSRKKTTGVKRVKGSGIWKNKESYPYDKQQLATIGRHCTDTEKRAEDASRDVQQYLRCTYLQKFVGDSFQGIVKTVTKFGLFVEMEKTYSEGLLHISQLRGDYYIFDKNSMSLRGEHSGVTYSTGTKVGVRLVKVDIEQGMIDLELDKDEKSARKKSKSKTKKERKLKTRKSSANKPQSRRMTRSEKKEKSYK